MSPSSWTVVLLTIFIPPSLLWIYLMVQRRRHPPTPAAIEASKWVFDWRFPRSWLPAFVSLWVFIGVSFAFRLAALPRWGKFALVLTAAATFLWFLIHFFREYRSEDDRTRRVQGDGCAFAVGSFLVWSLGMWVMLGPDRTQDASQSGLVWLPLSYCMGLFLSKSRYAFRAGAPPSTGAAPSGAETLAE